MKNGTIEKQNGTMTPEAGNLEIIRKTMFRLLPIQVLFARGIITGLHTVLITMAVAEGTEEICGRQPLWLTPLSAPSPVHSVCMDQTVFCSLNC